MLEGQFRQLPDVPWWGIYKVFAVQLFTTAEISGVTKRWDTFQIQI